VVKKLFPTDSDTSSFFMNENENINLKTDTKVFKNLSFFSLAQDLNYNLGYFIADMVNCTISSITTEKELKAMFSWTKIETFMELYEKLYL